MEAVLEGVDAVGWERTWGLLGVKGLCTFCVCRGVGYVECAFDQIQWANTEFLYFIECEFYIWTKATDKCQTPNTASII
jgi:hypothetical protein